MCEEVECEESGVGGRHAYTHNGRQRCSAGCGRNSCSAMQRGINDSESRRLSLPRPRSFLSTTSTTSTSTTTKSSTTAAAATVLGGLRFAAERHIARVTWT